MAKNEKQMSAKTKKNLRLIAVFLLLLIYYLVFGNNGATTTNTPETTAAISIVETTAETTTAAETVTETVTTTEATREETTALETTAPETTAPETTAPETTEEVLLKFRRKDLLQQHYEKHGIEMGFASAEEYEIAAGRVVNNPDALHKTEKEDGDLVYYVEATNEFVVVSKDGYIRTYFYPSAGIDYYNRQ